MEQRRGEERKGGGQMGRGGEGQARGGGGQAHCNQCGQNFGSQNELQEHNRRMHGGGGM